MNLRKLEGKKIRLIDIDGKVFTGYVGDYVAIEDNNSEEEAIILDIISHSNPIQFNKSEIKSISIL